jgi:hypothetical protein
MLTQGVTQNEQVILVYVSTFGYSAKHWQKQRMLYMQGKYVLVFGNLTVWSYFPF